MRAALTQVNLASVVAECRDACAGRHALLSHAFQAAPSPLYEGVERQAVHGPSALLQIWVGRGAHRAGEAGGSLLSIKETRGLESSPVRLPTKQLFRAN